MVMETIRETGSGESARPVPYGDFDGMTRAGALAIILAKSNEPEPEPKPSLIQRIIGLMPHAGE
jgi:hypothetical protein